MNLIKLSKKIIKYTKKLNSTNLSSFRSGNISVRAKDKGIDVIDVYKQKRINQNQANFNIDFENGKRVFHQKFGMGLIISSEGDKLNISFDKAGEKRVMASFVKIVD